MTGHEPAEHSETILAPDGAAVGLTRRVSISTGSEAHRTGREPRNCSAMPANNCRRSATGCGCPAFEQPRSGDRWWTESVTSNADGGEEEARNKFVTVRLDCRDGN